MRNSRGRILICERLGVDDAWQFPQGGIDDGRLPSRRWSGNWGGSRRGRGGYQDRRAQRPYRYLYGAGRIKRGHHGKEQLYFLCDYLGPDARINVETKHPEFQAFRWIAPADFQLAWLPEMKREVYRAVFADFFVTKI